MHKAKRLLQSAPLSALRATFPVNGDSFWVAVAQSQKSPRTGSWHGAAVTEGLKQTKNCKLLYNPSGSLRSPPPLSGQADDNTNQKLSPRAGDSSRARPVGDAAKGGSELSASCGRVSETENGQEQGELRTAVSKATLFQPEWPCVAGEVAFAKQKPEGVSLP